MDQCTHEVRAHYWKQIILSCQGRPIGQSAKQWLKENGIGEQSYYKWQRKLRQETYLHTENPTELLPSASQGTNISFAEIHVPQNQNMGNVLFCNDVTPTAVIKTATLSIAISNDISNDLLSRIISEVSTNA